MKVLQIATLAAAFALAGCASPIGTGSTANYETTACTDLNVTMGKTAKNISATAISRGKVDKLSIPFWVPGGTKAVSVIRSRQTAKIEQLQAEQAALYAARKKHCG